MTPLDALFLDENEQLVVSCVTRRPRSPVSIIASLTGIALDELERLIRRLVREAQLIEERIAGQHVYSVRYGRVKEGPRNMPTLDWLTDF